MKLRWSREVCASWLVATAMPLALGGCSGCGEDAPAGTCESSSDCGEGRICIDGRCRAREDAGPGPLDAGPGPLDAGHAERDAGMCVDEDGDGRGEGPDCRLGPDCDDADPARGGDEVCDEIDNDCDGMTDEGFADICAECTPQCGVHAFPGEDGWMLTDENSDGVIVDDDGALTLGRTTTESFSVWVANMNDGTVSRLDSRTNTEIARYPTARPDATNMARPWNEACNWSNRGNCPSRTAVDQRFDAYVANRAFGNMGTVTKYANREEDCIDRNANGVIDTSRDLDGDGTISMDPADGEFIGTEDECLLWTVRVGDLNGVPRALAVGVAPPDGEVGNVWVGLHHAMRACELDPRTGATIACIPITIRPYGAVADAMGRIWMVDRSGGRTDVLGYVTPSDMSWTMAPDVPAGTCYASYGVTVDGEGRVYVANSNCDPPLFRYDPATTTWTSYSIPTGGTPRGVAADEDHLWVGISHASIGFRGGWSNHVVQYRLSDMSYVATHTIPTGTGPVGVGVSFDGSVWAVCQGSNSAARLDPATGTWIEHGVGLTPYTYSDFMGYGLHTFANPRGWYRFVVEGCEDGDNRWQGARYSAEVPAMTSVELWARTADTRAGLSAEPWIGPFTGNPTRFLAPPGPLPERRYLEVEIRLATEDRTIAPRVFDIDVAGVCEPIIR